MAVEYDNMHDCSPPHLMHVDAALLRFAKPPARGVNHPGCRGEAHHPTCRRWAAWTSTVVAHAACGHVRNGITMHEPVAHTPAAIASMHEPVVLAPETGSLQQRLTGATVPLEGRQCTGLKELLPVPHASWEHIFQLKPGLMRLVSDGLARIPYLVTCVTDTALRESGNVVILY
jgi:hypothetical protein